MSDDPRPPSRPTYLELTDADRDFLVAGLRKLAAQERATIAPLDLPPVKQAKREACGRLEALVALFTTPRCTIVTPPARRAVGEDEPT